MKNQPHHYLRSLSRGYILSRFFKITYNYWYKYAYVLCMDRCSYIYMHVFVNTGFNVSCVHCSFYFITPIPKFRIKRAKGIGNQHSHKMWNHQMELEEAAAVTAKKDPSPWLCRSLWHAPSSIHVMDGSVICCCCYSGTHLQKQTRSRFPCWKLNHQSATGETDFGIFSSSQTGSSIKV